MSAVPSVLIVDDDADWRATLSEFLQSNGFEVLEAPDGQSALDQLLSENSPAPALMVLDLEMPNMSGWQLAQLMKSYHRLSRIPVLVLSGSDRLRASLDRPLVSALLSKPCDANLLLRSVNALVAAAQPTS